MTLASPIKVVSGVGTLVAKKLEKLAIHTVQDLLEHVPRRYEDWTNASSVAQLRIGDMATVQGEIIWAKNERSVRRRMSLTKALIREESGDIIATWFNQPFLLRSLVAGETRYFRGPVGFDRTSQTKTLVNPQIEKTPLIVPIYSTTAGLTSKMIRRLILACLPVADTLQEILSASIRQHYELVGRAEAFRLVHQPAKLANITTGQRRIAFDELVVFSLQLAQLRAQLQKDQAPILHVTDEELQAFTRQLPFKLTDDQRRAAWEIIQEIGEPSAMNRLLEGDVGTGKTVVAAFAAYIAARAGYQTLVLAPTTVLAEQHFVSFSQLLATFGLSVGQWTGTIKETPSAHPPDILIGTHALLHGQPPLGRVGLVVVDEQHRFGVEQRAALRTKGADGRVPHFLSMTATPIPRTLALALYGDLAISRIESRPADRLPIETRVIRQGERAATYQFIRDQVRLGRQVFVVCPLIEEAQGGETLFADLEQKSAKAEFERLSKEVFTDLRLGLLHGKLKPAEKQKVMDEFRRGAIDVLVATAVIEVGIDVPNASIMLIEGAERFGLSQLHQLRGRVGRGQFQSYCYLVSALETQPSLERLRHLEINESGIALAEIDLRLRGPGEFIGENQAGFPHFRYANLFDFDLMEQARNAADELLRQPLSPAVQKILADPQRGHME